MDITGIDYGKGKTNINLETGIRYGIIHQNHVLQAWADSSEPYYGEEEFPDEEIDMIEPIHHSLDDGEYLAHSDDYCDIFIIRSPYYTYGKFCSPCAPGAIDLMSPISGPIEYNTQMEYGLPLENNRGYCFGHDWFENDEAPYRVYDVITNKQVLP